MQLAGAGLVCEIVFSSDSIAMQELYDSKIASVLCRAEAIFTSNDDSGNNVGGSSSTAAVLELVKRASTLIADQH